MSNQKKSFVKKTVALVLIAGAAIGFGAWQYFKNKLELIKPTIEEQKRDFVEPSNKTSDLKIYRNEKYGFEIKYPKDLEIREKDDIDFDLYFDNKIFMSITDPEIENHLRLYAVEGSEKKVLIGKLEGSQFEIKSMKDGSLIQQTLIKKDNKLYLFFGKGEIFNNLIKNFKFL